MIPRRFVHVFFGLWFFSAPAWAAETDWAPETVEFFENRIRPVLAQDCYECHRSGETTKGGLALDHRAALMAGGDSGPVVVPGDPEGSLLIQAIRHEKEELKMPKNGAKIEASIIADFEKWVKMGAPDPRDRPATEAQVAKDTEWSAVMERRTAWWSFQQISKPEIPNVESSGNTRHPIDRFISARLDEVGLNPAGQADRRTLIRRLSFALRGLPPKPGEIERFVSDDQTGSYERLVDDYLESPRFGERWARHWMDWFRYAESHGSEGDPAIPNAWRYRDYLIRALNRDVPYDQLVREHLAGDQLEEPRLNEDLGLNESAIGPAQLRMVFHGFAPTDALEEQVRFTTDQIDVVSKAFMGLTVTCARCHDHKFDPISQEDFYAWYGIMASSRPSMVRADVPGEKAAGNREKLGKLKNTVKDRLANAWLKTVQDIPAKLLFPDPSLQERILKAEKESILRPMALMQENPDKFLNRWGERRARSAKATKAVHQGNYPYRWDLTQSSDFREWFHKGPTVDQPASAGVFAIAPEGNRILTGIYPSGVYSHLISSKDRGLLHSPRIQLDRDYDLWVRVIGDQGAMFRYSVQDYPRSGTVYPVLNLSGGTWRWQKYSLDYWQGDRIHLELTTAADQPVLAENDASRSWFGVREAVLIEAGKPFSSVERNSNLEPLDSVIQRDQPAESKGLASCYETAARHCLKAWKDDRMRDGQALFLDELVRQGLLPNRLDEVPSVRPVVEEYRRIEAQLPVPTRVPGVMETAGFDQPLFKKGNHKKPAQPVPRRFLEAIDPTPYETEQSGRLELANDFVRPDNPLTRRVIVNRIWHHLFGRGLVATPDNFGRLGKPPSHPQLLDYLAVWFGEQGWSIKELIRFIVTSDTWKRSSVPSERAEKLDPDNRLLSHFGVRRLEAEAIRDALLAVSGELKVKEMYGPPVSGNASRRSIYVRVKRNDLDPFLATFDAPVPASTTGRRDTTNVPDQSLTLLNDELVADLAGRWAQRVRQGEGVNSDEERIEQMFLRALGRYPTDEELKRTRQFLERVEVEREQAAAEREQLNARIQEIRQKLDDLSTLATERVLAGRKNRTGNSGGPPAPVPLALWDFDRDVQDQIGPMDGEKIGGARIENGALVVGDDGGYLATEPLETELKAKTLEVWVQLDTLDQRGGGAMTVQDLKGVVFDSIVFGEREPKRWMAGSNNFRRTRDLNGPEEQEAVDGPVHIAMVYSEDGTIRCYRNGQPYGKAYESNGPVTFESGKSQVLFGNRHGTPGGNRLLRGRIHEARMYGRALTDEEVAASARANEDFVSEQERLAAMQPIERDLYKRLRSDLGQMESRLKDKNETEGLSSKWANLAHALFNLKEFIYIR